jgi:hypothetical protein
MILFGFLGILLIWLIGLLWTIGFSFGIVFILWLCKSEYACRRWPHVSGTITETKLEKSDDENDCDIVTLKFSYHIEGMDFQSSHCREFTPCFKKHIAEFMEKYKEGTSMEVYYDPRNPSSTKLEVVKSFWIFVPGFIPLTLGLAAGVFVLIYWWPF